MVLNGVKFYIDGFMGLVVLVLRVLMFLELVWVLLKSDFEEVIMELKSLLIISVVVYLGFLLEMVKKDWNVVFDRVK